MTSTSEFDGFAPPRSLRFSPFRSANRFVAGLRAGAAYSKVEFDINEEFRINGAIDEIGHHDASTNNIAPVYGVLNISPTSRVSLRLDWQKIQQS